MPRWLRRLLDKHFTRTVYSPEIAQLGPIGDKDWPGLLEELAEGYERHKAIFHAVQILLRKTEGEAFRMPTLKSPADVELWKTEQYGIMREANMLRTILRLPIEGQKLKRRREAAENAKREAAEPEAQLD